MASISSPNWSSWVLSVVELVLSVVELVLSVVELVLSVVELVLSVVELVETMLPPQLTGRRRSRRRGR
jgi:hypothetical protein